MNARWGRLKELFDDGRRLSRDERARWLAGLAPEDATLRGELESLLASPVPDSFLDAPALARTDAARDVLGELGARDSAEAIGRRFGPYRVVRELGRGGMGVVYLAVRDDQAFEKQVAIKLLHASAGSVEAVARFHRERQILARLEHPNIARLLDGGSNDDKLSYFVMEYIEGQPIDVFCEERRLSVTQRLELFLACCAAVVYAHRNLIVHRDIKPSNILVTAEGVPRLLDFGIAKLIDPTSGTDATLTAGVAFSPAYASPEQVRNEPLTTATDVYSLGVLLYEMLTGRSPYRLTSQQPLEVVRAIVEQEPERPSTGINRSTVPEKLRQRLRGDLDTILLKTLQKDPERRYASVQELADDVRRHLDGRPVAARQDSITYRTLKFVRRHKAGAAAGAVIAAVLAGATVLTARQARVVRHERDRAEQRFNQVRKLANAVLFDYQDEIEKLAGSTAIRSRMLKDGLEYLDTLSAESGGDVALQRELAMAYDKVADVQGAAIGPNVGDSTGALASYRKALAIRERLSAAAPGDEKLRIDVLRSLGQVSEVLLSTGDIGGSLAACDKALALAGVAPKMTPERRRAIRWLRGQHAQALVASGALARASEDHRQAIAIADDLLRDDPHDANGRRSKAVSLMRLGDTDTLAGRFDEALKSQREGMTLFESLESADDVNSRRDVALAMQRVSYTLGLLGDHRGALKLAQRYLERSESDARADPADARARLEVCVACFHVATHQSALGDHEAALQNMRRAVALGESELARRPNDTLVRGDLAEFLTGLGDVAQKSGRVKEALTHYQKAETATEALFAEDPKDTVRRGYLAEIQMGIGDVQMRLDGPAAALAVYRKALAIADEVVAATPENVDQRRNQALLRAKVGACHVARAEGAKAGAAGRSADWQEAARWYRLSLETWTHLADQKAVPADEAGEPVDARRQLARCQAALALPPR
jgi:tetratricopeptide (TPR) repeat protein